MKTRLLIILGMIVFALYGTDAVYGLSCDGSDITQSFAESDVVFAGQALSKEYVSSEHSSSDGKNDAITQFSIIENFKGTSQEIISIISSEWLWGYNFTKNLEYVVFAYDDGKHLRHQTCTPTSLLQHAELEQIRQVANDLELVVANSTHVKWNVGEIKWLEISYPPSGTGVIRVIDLDMNLNPEKIDHFDIFVWSDSNKKGYAPTATETGVSTGIFESTLFFSLNDESSGPRLKVEEGDTVTAEYKDKTLPASYTSLDVLSIIAKSEIRTPLESPLKQLKSGILVDEIQCRENLTLIKKHDGSPVCVKPTTVDKLYERGWTHPLTTSFCFLEYVPVCGVDDITYSNQCFMDKSGVELKHDGECENFTPPDYELDETEFLQIKNNMENTGYHICDIQLEENIILIVLNWIFEDSEPEKMILSKIPSNVSYEIKYLDEYADYFISKESVYSCEGLENEH